MQVKIQETKPEFEPFDLVISVSNIKDLINLWAVFNASISTKIANCNLHPFMERMIDYRTDEIFNAIDDMKKKYQGAIK